MIKYLKNDWAIGLLIVLAGAAVAFHAGLRLEHVENLRFTRYAARTVGGTVLVCIGLGVIGSKLRQTLANKPHRKVSSSADRQTDSNN